MLSKTKLLSLVLLVSGLLVSIAYGDGKISGIVFGDYYYVAKSHRGEDLENRNGFWIRRIYFTYDNAVSERIKIRFRMEFNQNGDFVSKGKITPYIKDANFQWKINEKNLMIMGISPPPTYDVIEEIWGYRDLEKTPLDLQKIRDSRDFGLAFKGDKGKISYHLFLGNGSGTDVELDRGKVIYAAIGYEISKSLFVQAYADYDYKNEENSSYIAQLFIAHKRTNFRIGAHYSYCLFNEKDKEINQNIVSAFAIYKLNNKVDFIFRYDAMLDPNPKGESIAYLPFNATEASNLVIVAASYQPHKSIRLIPNIKYIFYGNETKKNVKSDIFFNLTFTYYF